MLQVLKRRREDEEGFTLIELMVVVLIIAILLAIAIPTFLGARERAQNRAAQSNIRNAYAAEKVLYTDEQAFTTLNSALVGVEPSLTYAAAAPALTKDNAVFIQVAANAATPAVARQVVCVSTTSQTGNVYSVREIATGPGAGVKYYADEDATPSYPSCTATSTDFSLTKW